MSATQLDTTMPLVVDTKTAARLLSTSTAMILYRIRRGDLPARRFGRTWRIAIRDIQVIAGAEEERR